MGNVKLEKMTLEDYNDYILSAITDYETELLLSGRSDTKQAAHEFAVWEYNDIFKNGFCTPNTYLYNITVNGQKVGILWFLNEDKQGLPGEAFIGDFLIYEIYRKKGYGYQALLIAEGLAKAQGLTEMRLGVMNHNTKAKKLYIRAGYTVFKEREHDCIMRKFLL
jgi:ribosomal protein S18 acetylase RimI-like enzyme